VPKRVLGKGLEALIPESINEFNENEIQELRISDIDPNSSQPRKSFDEDSLKELAQSIRQHGVIQPITVRPNGDRYMIITGERRWRAARLAGLKTIPAIVKDLNDNDILEIALIENIQREDLNPIEQAKALKMLIEKFNFTQEDLAERLGKNRSTIANTMRLLNLSENVQNMIINGKLSEGHARALLGVSSKKMQEELAITASNTGLTVRELEKIVKMQVSKQNHNIQKQKLNPNLQECADKLSQMLGTKVNIISNKRKGRIEIEYYSEEDLYRIIELLIEL